MAARRLTRTFMLRLVVLHETPGPPTGGDPGSSAVQLTARVTAEVIVPEDGTDEFLAEAAPGARLALTREKQAQAQRAAMTGTGTSDAPALAQPDADAGIAMNTGAAAKAASSMPALAPNPRS
jgi:high-affinity K+ transport system ATPase subunit B